MKLRIRDNSLRMRISPEEFAQLRETGKLQSRCCIPSPAGEVTSLIYTVEISPDAAESSVVLEPFCIRFIITPSDFEAFSAPKNEGAYFRLEFTNPLGEKDRFTYFLEKDRPGVSCAKPEEMDQLPGWRELAAESTDT
jgi:hypothetical protein